MALGCWSFGTFLSLADGTKDPLTCWNFGRGVSVNHSLSVLETAGGLGCEMFTTMAFFLMAAFLALGIVADGLWARRRH